MQEIKKRSIVLASVLKPVDDTRMLEKMAVSLANTGKWSVHVIGSGSQVPQASNITFHPLGAFRRVSIKRIMTPWRILNLLFKINPDQVIVTTHELLLVGVVYKLLTGSILYYDIQENYKLNILNTNVFRPILRITVAMIVRGVEWLTSPFIKHFFLAEKTYTKELPFIGKKFTVLENKALLPNSFKRLANDSKIKLLFSGTLDFSTGVFEAIALAKKLNEQSGNVSLTIIGFAAVKKVREEIREIASQYSFIEAIGIDQPVPHRQILQVIREATAGIIYYPDAAHIANRIPTKLYEYLAAQLPILYDTKATWRDIPERWQAGVAIDFHSPDVKGMLEALTSVSFYPEAPQGVFWEKEAELLVQTLDRSNS